MRLWDDTELGSLLDSGSNIAGRVSSEIFDVHYRSNINKATYIEAVDMLNIVICMCRHRLVFMEMFLGEKMRGS